MENEVDQDAVCKICNDHYEWGSSLCEGSRCEEAHEMYLEAQEEEYLNEGGKDVSEFHVGDRVHHDDGFTGKIVKIENHGKNILIEKDVGPAGSKPYIASSCYVNLINKPKTTKENKMNISDNILTVFEDSATMAGKIANRFGSEYGDTTRDLLALRRDRKDLLAILKAEEDEAKKDNK